MNRTMLALGATLLLLGVPAVAREATVEPETTLEEILSGYYEAIGGLEAWESVSTIKMVGTMGVPRDQLQAPLTLKFKAPDKARLEVVVQGTIGVQAVSGDVAWQIMPFIGKPDPEPMPADQARLMTELADFDGPLVNWKEDGHSVEYLGVEEVEGAEAHKLEVTLAGGQLRHFFLDAESLLPIKSSGKTTIQGQSVWIETVYGDYRKVGELVLPHSIESRPVGGPAGQLIVIASAELNVEMADDQFAMPAGGR